jgi:hypothetical protein
MLSGSAFGKRREEDLKKLQALAVASGGKIEVVRVVGDPPSKIVLLLKYKTAANSGFPSQSVNSSQLVVDLSSRYPFQEPVATFGTKVFHPNVFSSGKICLGTKWIPTEGLDLLIKRIVQIITFDPVILNEKSPANGEALAWYRRAIASNPSSFPTESVNFEASRLKPAISWADTSSKSSATEADKVLVECRHCGKRMRLPAGRTGSVRCPSCEKSFEVRT